MRLWPRCGVPPGFWVTELPRAEEVGGAGWGGGPRCSRARGGGEKGGLCDLVWNRDW
jgi:hypothetical protein